MVVFGSDQGARRRGILAYEFLPVKIIKVPESPTCHKNGSLRPREATSVLFGSYRWPLLPPNSIRDFRLTRLGLGLLAQQQLAAEPGRDAVAPCRLDQKP